MQEDRAIVLPGEMLKFNTISGIEDCYNKEKNVYQINSVIVSSQQQKDDIIKMEHLSNNYTPKRGDKIIGLVVKVIKGYYVIQISNGQRGILSHLGFNGATKRNKPNLQVGSLVYCKLDYCHQDQEFILTCVSDTNAKEWSSGESKYGELKNGFEINISQWITNYLINDDTLFSYFAQKLAFQVCIGSNGKIWFKTKTPQNYINLNQIVTFIENKDFYKEDYEELLKSEIQKMTIAS